MEYKTKKVKEHGYIVTENGHTMFPFDVEQRLKRLDYLEQEKTDIRNLNLKLKKALDAAVSAIYFTDNHDYKSSLYEVVRSLLGKEIEDKININELYALLNPEDDE